LPKEDVSESPPTNVDIWATIVQRLGGYQKLSLHEMKRNLGFSIPRSYSEKKGKPRSLFGRFLKQPMLVSNEDLDEEMDIVESTAKSPCADEQVFIL
jgi:hypothetical protein